MEIEPFEKDKDMDDSKSKDGSKSAQQAAKLIQSNQEIMYEGDKQGMHDAA